ncbi:MAG TPA: hypothetical protein VHW66_10360 [Stellaceae bacterium]|jgi:hypothetical protein|nr:hypothetical protein [Stellaceae bacterium]
MTEPASPAKFADMLKDAGLDPSHDPARFEELREGTAFLDRLRRTVRRPRERAAEPAHIFVHPKG